MEEHGIVRWQCAGRAALPGLAEWITVGCEPSRLRSRAAVRTHPCWLLQTPEQSTRTLAAAAGADPQPRGWITICLPARG
jgi:hypothetical protein